VADEQDPQEQDPQEQLKAIEDDPPSDPRQWPSGAAKYETFGGQEGEHGYEEGPEANLGPSGLRHHEDGSVSIDGEMVDNPQDYKGEPIPGGPTDVHSAGIPGEEKKTAGHGGDAER